MNAETMVSDLNKEFARLKEIATKALDQVNEKQFFQTIDPESNSIAIIVKHLAGNMKSRWRDFLTSDGEKPDRRRDHEFMVLDGDNRDSIMQQFEEGWLTLFGAITPLQDGDLQRTVYIRGEPLTVFQAMIRHVSHYGYHVGQIVVLARHFRQYEWQTLSIAKGKSEDFNKDPQAYIRKG